MSATEFINELKAMSADDRERVFATLAENPEWREDILDLITIAERRSEPARPLNDVLKDLKIKA